MTTYRDAASTCPACGGGLLPAEEPAGALRCGGCEGVWVEEAAFARLSAEVGADVSLITSSAEPGARRCPVCGQPLWGIDAAGVAVDRCGEHGIWFDRGELAAALQGGVEKATKAGDDHVTLRDVLGFFAGLFSVDECRCRCHRRSSR